MILFDTNVIIDILDEDQKTRNSAPPFPSLFCLGSATVPVAGRCLPRRPLEFRNVF